MHHELLSPKMVKTYNVQGITSGAIDAVERHAFPKTMKAKRALVKLACNHLSESGMITRNSVLRAIKPGQVGSGPKRSNRFDVGDLPNDVIQSIAHLLPFKEAGRLSAVSRNLVQAINMFIKNKMTGLYNDWLDMRSKYTLIDPEFANRSFVYERDRDRSHLLQHESIVIAFKMRSAEHTFDLSKITPFANKIAELVDTRFTTSLFPGHSAKDYPRVESDSEYFASYNTGAHQMIFVKSRILKPDRLSTGIASNSGRLYLHADIMFNHLFCTLAAIAILYQEGLFDVVFLAGDEFVYSFSNNDDATHRKRVSYFVTQVMIVKSMSLVLKGLGFSEQSMYFSFGQHKQEVDMSYKVSDIPYNCGAFKSYLASLLAGMGRELDDPVHFANLVRVLNNRFVKRTRCNVDYTNYGNIDQVLQ